MRKARSTPPDVREGRHLNIGCGGKLWDGFVNIDFPSNWSGIPPDIECDIRMLPFEDGYADTAWAIHVLEHFHRWETEAVLKEWKRVLKPGGQLVIEVPCLDMVIKYFIHSFKNGTPINDQMTLWRLYGDPSYKNEHMVHKWCFSGAELVDLMKVAGFSNVVLSQPEYHHPQIDMRVTGIK